MYLFKCIDDTFIIYMGKDKHENEELIRWGWPCDIWFHVDNLSSAHVYLRMPENCTIDTIPEEVLNDCIQLVKANSIQGCKINNVPIVYTPWSNLKKKGNMDVGQVGFHDEKLVRKTKVVKKDNAILNRLNKTKEERAPNYRAEREQYDREMRDKSKAQQKKEAAMVAQKKEEEEREKAIRSYDPLFVEEDMKTNTAIGMSAQEYEEDFM